MGRERGVTKSAAREGMSSINEVFAASRWTGFSKPTGEKERPALWQKGMDPKTYENIHKKKKSGRASAKVRFGLPRINSPPMVSEAEQEKRRDVCQGKKSTFLDYYGKKG